MQLSSQKKKTIRQKQMVLKAYLRKTLYIVVTLERVTKKQSWLAKKIAPFERSIVIGRFFCVTACSLLSAPEYVDECPLVMTLTGRVKFIDFCNSKGLFKTRSKKGSLASTPPFL